MRYRYKEVASNVFGTSKCAKDLVSILNGYNNYTYVRKVGRTLNSYKEAMLDLSQTNKMTNHFYHLYLHYTINKVEKLNLPENIKTRLLNLIRAQYKIYLNKLNEKN